MSRVKRLAVILPIVLVSILSGCKILNVTLLGYRYLSEFVENDLGFTSIYGIVNVEPEVAKSFVDVEMTIEPETFTTVAHTVAFVFGEKDGKEVAYFFSKNKSYYYSVNKKDYRYHDMGDFLPMSYKEMLDIARKRWGECNVWGSDAASACIDERNAVGIAFVRVYDGNRSEARETRIDFLRFPDGSFGLYSCKTNPNDGISTHTLIEELVAA